MNLLNKEDSPYLKQHEHNPVHWYPWGEEALQKAKEERKPIFVSIGYSTCHWCHVMEREVFEKEEFAKTLNENFISIKIDREERPDIDKYYQEIYQIMNKRAGGWPLSMFLTHEGKPFFAGTYIPPTPKHGMLGFNELLHLILEKYQTNFDDIIQSSETLTAILSEKKSSKRREIGKNLEEKISGYLKENFDTTDGGFSRAPKFPHHDMLLYILEKTRDKDLESKGEFTLKKMAEGGLYDIVEGGFCRYSVDEEWLVPHFEKMLYDNGLLTGTYAKAYFKFQDEFFKNIAVENCDFMINRMSEDNLFYSASDADTEGEEGKYFVYSYKELINAGLEDSQIRAIGGSKIGNFERKNIVRTFELDPKVKKVLLDLRSKREYPFIDKKIVVFQNAMMIKALFIMSKIDPKYLENATVSLEKLMATFRENGLKRSKIGENEAKIDGFLEDYAYLIEALLTAYRYTQKEEYLEEGIKLLNTAKEKFYDDGVWYFSKGDFPTIADVYDNSYPSAVGVLMSAIKSVKLLESSYEEVFEKSCGYYWEKLENIPYAATTFVGAIESRVVKVSVNLESAEMLASELNPIELEKIIFHINKGEKIELCDDKSCFLSTTDFQEVLKEIRS